MTDKNSLNNSTKNGVESPGNCKNFFENCCPTTNKKFFSFGGHNDKFVTKQIEIFN